MRPVFQEIERLATAKLREGLPSYSEEEGLERWDSDSFEQEVRQFCQQLGQQMLQVWAEEQTQQAQAQARFCPCGQRRQVHQRQSFWWLSTFGRVRVEVPYLDSPEKWSFKVGLTALQGRSDSSQALE